MACGLTASALAIDHLIAEVVLKDIRHVLNGFAAYLLRGDHFNVIKPSVWVIASGTCCFLEATDFGGPCVVGR